jgi:hypothetical protein
LRPRLIRQALAARERGNIEAAFFLLREAVALRPDDDRAVLTLWDVATTCGRVAAAAEPMARFVRRQAAAGQRDIAAGSWIALAAEAPETAVDAAALVRIVPELRARVERALDDEAREHANAWLLRALRQSVDPRSGSLTPGLAFRLFEEAREIDPETARRAARVVLGSPELHETKRARVEKQLRELSRKRPKPRALARRQPAGDAMRVTEAAPVELAEQGLLVRELASAQRARIDYRAIEAVAAAEVEGLASEPMLVIDLVLRGSPTGRSGRHLLRMRRDAFDPNTLATAGVDTDQALSAFLCELLERTQAVPLPDPDSALGIRPRRFPSLGDYEREVVGRLQR